MRGGKPSSAVKGKKDASRFGDVSKGETAGLGKEEA